MAAIFGSCLFYTIDLREGFTLLAILTYFQNQHDIEYNSNKVHNDLHIQLLWIQNILKSIAYNISISI